jgi:hypothetical protein
MLAEATGGISMAVYLGQAVLNKIVFCSTLSFTAWRSKTITRLHVPARILILVRPEWCGAEQLPCHLAGMPLFWSPLLQHKTIRSTHRAITALYQA